MTIDGLLIRDGRVRRAPLAALLAALAASALVAAYAFWLRDSSLFAVERTTVSGLTADDGEIEAALVEAASEMTTLNVDRRRLLEAVAAHPIVAGVEIDRQLPNGLAIEVIEHRPLAAVVPPGGRPLAVAGDGTVLPSVEPDGELARVESEQEPRGGVVRDEQALTALAALEAAPEALAEQARGVTIEAPAGLSVQLVPGIEVVLGEPAELEQKWAAAAAVLAEGDLAEVGYVDVSLPERPTAGTVP